MAEFNADRLSSMDRAGAEEYIRQNPDFAAELATSGYAMDKLLGYYLAELLKRIAAHKAKKPPVPTPEPSPAPKAKKLAPQDKPAE